MIDPPPILLFFSFFFFLFPFHGSPRLRQLIFPPRLHSSCLFIVVGISLISAYRRRSLASKRSYPNWQTAANSGIPYSRFAPYPSSTSKQRQLRLFSYFSSFANWCRRFY
ncbi:hypothetical protein V8C37DRAFT_390589 [Trichoderma ceciliae]